MSTDLIFLHYRAFNCAPGSPNLDRKGKLSRTGVRSWHLSRPAISFDMMDIPAKIRPLPKVFIDLAIEGIQVNNLTGRMNKSHLTNYEFGKNSMQECNLRLYSTCTINDQQYF